MKRTDSRLLAGLILFVIGAAVFAYGIIGWNSDRAALGSAIQRIFTGSTAGEREAVIEMIAGGAVAAIGLVFLLVRRSPRR